MNVSQDSTIEGTSVVGGLERDVHAQFTTFIDDASLDTIRTAARGQGAVAGALDVGPVAVGVSSEPDAYATTGSIDYFATYLAEPKQELRDGLEYQEYGDHGMIIHRISGRGSTFGYTYPGGSPSKRFKLNADDEEMRDQFKPEIWIYPGTIGDYGFQQRVITHEGAHNYERDHGHSSFKANHEETTRRNTGTTYPNAGAYHV